VFNFSGSEIIFLLLLALIILGPEKLPDAVRSFGRTYSEFKKMTTGFQSELKQALDEPMREMRETADAIKQAANFDAAADLLEGKKAPPVQSAPAPFPAAPPAAEAGAEPAVEPAVEASVEAQQTPPEAPAS
jgi:sec-independent protein translocase protein TatB